MTTQTIPAELHTTARRLRYLRRYPNPVSGNWGDDYKTGMAHGYEYALRVLLDEFHIYGDDWNNWYALMYGPQGEDPDLQSPD